MICSLQVICSPDKQSGCSFIMQLYLLRKEWWSILRLNIRLHPYNCWVNSQGLTFMTAWSDLCFGSRNWNWGQELAHGLQACLLLATCVSEQTLYQVRKLLYPYVNIIICEMGTLKKAFRYIHFSDNKSVFAQLILNLGSTSHSPQHSCTS